MHLFSKERGERKLFIIHVSFSLKKSFKGIVSKLRIKFWMCQKYGKMKDYNKKKMTTSAVE
jgi:hypothetical protein